MSMFEVACTLFALGDQTANLNSPPIYTASAASTGTDNKEAKCRRNATPFQTERLINQPARLITFHWSWSAHGRRSAIASAVSKHPVVMVSSSRDFTGENPESALSQNHSPGMYLSSNKTLTDSSKPTPQNKATEANASNSATAFSDALGNKRKANAAIPSSCVVRRGLLHGIELQHLV
jgi:hypothetical protein